jgi:DNA-binding LytR/AlgR family response regulator
VQPWRWQIDRTVPHAVPFVTKGMSGCIVWTRRGPHRKLVAVIERIALEFRRRIRLPGWLVPPLYGFLFWLVFLLVLEPDNVMRAAHAGYPLPFGIEAARILAAALLGAIATPVLMTLSRRFPLVGADRWRHVAIHLLGNTCLGFVLIVASCFLAAWGFQRKLLPSLVDVRDELTANWTLLVFALCAFTAIVQVVRFVRGADEAKDAAADAPVADPESAARIPIKTGGRLRLVDPLQIDWVEAQGNYVALHAGPHMQLVRRTLTDFETELDTSRFVRIHRSVIVAIDRIDEMQPLPNGDATLRLGNGHELRVSRRYREEVVRRWQGTRGGR